MRLGILLGYVCVTVWMVLRIADTYIFTTLWTMVAEVGALHFSPVVYMVHRSGHDTRLDVPPGGEHARTR